MGFQIDLSHTQKLPRDCGLQKPLVFLANDGYGKIGPDRTVVSPCRFLIPVLLHGSISQNCAALQYKIICVLTIIDVIRGCLFQRMNVNFL
jgi:hypothetical protein